MPIDLATNLKDVREISQALQTFANELENSLTTHSSFAIVQDAYDKAVKDLKQAVPLFFSSLALLEGLDVVGCRRGKLFAPSSTISAPNQD